MPGTNAKMNELQALMGLQVLRYMDDIIARRKRISELYRERLKDLPGIKMPPPLPADISYNYAFFPIEVDEKEFGLSRDGLYEALKRYNVYSRRYFYPLVSDFACYQSISTKDPLSVARRVADRILTLPIYDALPLDEVDAICNIIEHVRHE